MDLKDKTGAEITPKIKIELSLVSEPGETVMEDVDTDISRLDSAIGSTPISALGKVLQLTKNIVDAVADVCYY